MRPIRISLTSLRRRHSIIMPGVSLDYTSRFYIFNSLGPLVYPIRESLRDYLRRGCYELR